MIGRSMGDITVDTGKKDKMIHLKCSESEKLKIEAFASSKGFKYVSDFIRWAIATAMSPQGSGVSTNMDKVDTEIATLKSAIQEFNKLMSYNKGLLIFPEDLDKNIIREGVKISFQMKT